MAEEPQVAQVVAELTERVRARLHSIRGGDSGGAPGAYASGPAPRNGATTPATECAPDCGSCPSRGACPTVGALDGGAARISPDRIRTSADIAPFIDHTLLKPDATPEEVQKLAEEARRYGFKTVCVNSAQVATAARVLAGSSVVPIAVVGFPLGASLPTAKAFEAREAIRCGAREIDMVINIGALKGRDYALVLDDIRRVVEASRPHPVKVILETSQLSDEEKISACVLSKAAGAAFVKTSTGFGGGGATADDVALMRRVVGDEMGVKASGGVRSTDDARKMIAAGANRLGASASVAIVKGERAAGGRY